MREIKFRAWTKEKDGTWRGPWYGGFYFHATGLISDRELLPAGEIEVEQFTGLEDKNGVEVYEGDILRTRYGSVATVRFGTGIFDSGVYMFTGFYLEFGNGSQGEDSCQMDEESCLDYEVISNAHEYKEQPK